MAVFIFYNYYYPAYKAGGPTQSLKNLTEQLNTIPFEVICAANDLDGTPLNVPVNKWVQRNNYLRVWYAKGNDIFSWIQFLKKLTMGAWYINGLYSFRFVMLPIIFGRRSKLILSPRGVLDPGSLSQKAFKKKLYLFIWKVFGFHKKCIFHASSSIEEINIKKVFGNNVTIATIPNLPNVLNLQPMPYKQVNQLILATVAVISPMKNYLSVINALQNVKASVIYHIYGPIKEHNYWHLCEAEIQKLPANITVQYHGDIIPDKVPEVLANAHVYIQPSISENFGHSLYEALSMGRPIITSFDTPWKNLEQAKSGFNIHSDDLDGLAKAISFFASMEQNILQQWGSKAKAYSEAAINIEQIKNAYIALFNQP